MTPVWRIVPPAVERASHREYGRPLLRRDTRASTCRLCGAGRWSDGTQSLKLAWEGGSPRKLGDFVWPQQATGEILVSSRVSDALRAGFAGLALQPVLVEEHVEDRDTGAPRGLLPQAFGALLSSYQALDLTGAPVPIQWDRSSIRLAEGIRLCPDCGRVALRWEPYDPRYTHLLSPGSVAPAEVIGTEWVEITSRPLADEPTFRRHPRHAGKGAFFKRSDLNGVDLWRARQDESALLCSSRFKAVIQDLGATNVEFLEVGTILD